MKIEEFLLNPAITITADDIKISRFGVLVISATIAIVIAIICFATPGCRP